MGSPIRLFLMHVLSPSLSYGLQVSKKEPGQAHQEQWDAGDVEQRFLKAEEVELMELHDEEVDLSPTTFVFENFSGMSV